MRVKPKKVVQPASIKALTDAVLNAPEGGLVAALDKFRWTFDKGDLNHWAPLLNHFDAYLEQNIGSRCDLKLEWKSGETDPAFPVAEVLAILRVTAIILENCGNKHAYQSTEHLAALLAAPAQVVVNSALAALMALVRKAQSSNTRFAGELDLNKRLLAIAQGWGGKEQGLDLVACTSQDESSIQQRLPKATKLQFSFYRSSTQTAREDQIGLDNAGELCTIIIPSVSAQPSSEHELLRELVEKYNVPKYLRFKLLSQIRVAKRFATLEGRRQLVVNRLMAFVVYMQANPSQEELATFFLGETELVSELINLVEGELVVHEAVRMLALRALAVQLLDRQRHNIVITALSAGGQSGLLATLMRSSIATLTDPVGSQGPPISIAFVEALFSLIGALVASSSGCSALASAGLIPAFLPMLKDYEPSHMHLVNTAVRIMETYMDFVTTASTLFRDLGGLTQMIARLDVETRAGSQPLQQPGSATAMQTSPAAAAPVTAAGTVPYARRNLLKSLLRAVALASYSPGSGARPQEQDQENLFRCLRQMMDHAKEFGGQLLSLAASVMTDLIHHDPLVFSSINQAGLPQAFINSIKAGVIPTGDAIACVPTALVAICLNTSGAVKVRESAALECLIPVLTTPAYIRALNGETLGGLGTGLDELMRHVPSLRESVVDMLLKVLRTLAAQGGREETASASSPGVSSSSMPAASSSDAAQPMETDGSTHSGGNVVGPSGSIAEAESSAASASAEKGHQLGEMIQRTARVLEALLGNNETSRLFMLRGGVQALLPLYELPSLVPSFGSHSPLHAVTAALRILAQMHAKLISRLLAAALQARLQKMRPLAQATQEASVPNLPQAQRDEYTRQLQMTEGLLALAASIARMSVDLLAETSKGDESITVQVSELERIIVKQTTLAQEWKVARDAAKAAEAAKKQGEQEGEQAILPPIPPPAFETAVPPVAHPVPEVDPAGVQDDDIMQDGPSDDGAAPQGESALESGQAKNKKRTGPELAYDALIQFASTARLFYVQIAKAIHNPSRRREEVPGTPSMPMQAAAAVVSITMRDALTSAHTLWPGLYEALLPEACRTRPVETTQLANYITHMAGGLGNTLFDSRRRTCHSLILNYFVAGNGLQILLEHFTLAVNLLKVTATIEVPAASSDKPGEEKASPEKLLKTAVEGTVRMFLQLLDHLVNAEQLLNSPQAATLLLTPVPGSKHPPKQTTADELVKGIQSAVSAAVLPLWAEPDLAATSTEVAQRIVSILTKCTNGTSRVTHTVPSLARQGMRAFQPDPGVVQQIVDMGFAQPRAEEALRRVQHNSVELAMEWIINHPDETAPSTASQPPDTELVQSFCGIINQDGPSSSSAAPAETVAPGPVQLVEGAVSMLAKSPSAAFSLSDLLAALCKQNSGENSKVVIQRLVELLRGGIAGQKASIAGRSAASLQAPAHLLAVLTSEDPTLVAVGHRQGAATLALDLIEEWMQTAMHSRTAKAWAESGGIAHPPSWIDALLLILDQAIKVQPSHPGTTPGQPQGAASDSFQVERPSASPTGEQPVADSKDQKQAGTDQGAPSTASEVDPAISKLHSTIRSLYSSGGLLTDQEQIRATRAAISLLRYLQVWPKTKSSEKENETLASPGSHAQAVLQLLARLTKKHSLAQQALSSKVHHLILSLPASALKPEHAAHMCAIMRHLLEDPVTLQAAMEAEIRSTLVARGPMRPSAGTSTPTSMALRPFLTKMATVIGRDPTVFFEALLATCCVVKPAGQPVIQLKPAKAQPKTARAGSTEEADKVQAGSQEQPGAGPSSKAEEAAPSTSGRPTFRRRLSNASARTPKQRDDDKDSQPKNTAKGGRKTIPASFVEIIDTLVDLVSNYQGVILSSASANEGPVAAKEGSSSQAPGTTSSAPEQQQPQSGSISSGPSASSSIALHSSSERASAVATAAAAAIRPPKVELDPKEHTVLIQCLALKMLTDFTLMYNASVGVILRRDAEAAAKGGSPRARTPSRKEASKHTGTLFRHILSAQLAHDPEPGWAMQSLAQQASYFLLAVSIRSAEGRRRIVGCIVDRLTGGNSACLQSNDPAKWGPKPPLYKVKALVELITSLMCITPSSNAPRSSSDPNHFQEMMRAMVDAGVRKALLQVLKTLDINHPKAPQLVNTILKPFEVLTRSFLWQQRKSHPGASAGQQPAAPLVPGHMWQMPVPDSRPAPTAETAARRESGAADGEGAVQAAEESAAGPEALAAAQQAIEQYGRRNDGDVDPEAARDLEDMVEAIMEQAYAEDMLDDYNSGDSEQSDDEMDDDEEAMAEGPLSTDEHDAMEESGESGEEDNDEDMSEDYSTSEGSSEEDHLHDHLDEEGVILHAGDPDDEDEEGFLEAEEDAAEANEHLVLEGPDFNVIDNAFQQGLNVGHEDNVPDEDEDAHFEDHEGWEEDGDEEEDEDDEGEDPLDPDGMEAGDMPDDSIEWDLDAPHLPRPGFAGIAGLQNPTQAMIEELFGSLGRAGLGIDRRRYHVITQQLPTAGAARPRRPAQHALLQRPVVHQAATGQHPTHRELHPMASALMSQLGLRRHQVSQLGMFASDRHGGGYVVFPDGRAPGNLERLGIPNPPQPQTGPPEASSILTSSIEMLMGSSGQNGRQESRMANWSDDGLPPTVASAAPGLVAGTLEQQLAEVLAERPARDAAPAPGTEAAERTTFEPAAEPHADEPATDGVLQQPEGSSQPAASPVASSAEQPVARPNQTDSAQRNSLAAAAAQPEPPQAAGCDEEMADAEPTITTPVPDAAETQTPAPRAADMEMGSGGGVDLAFLDALPPDLRAEMLASQATSGTQHSSQPDAPEQPTQSPEAGTATPAAQPAAQGPGAAAESARQETDDMEGIDPEFIAALPPDLQAEVLEQQRRERRLRQAAARRAEAQAQAAAAAPASGAASVAAGAADMDMATLLATFPAEVREEVLLTSDDSLLATLTPALLAEAQNLRERALRSHRDPAGGPVMGGLQRSLLNIGRDPRPMGEDRGVGAIAGDRPRRNNLAASLLELEERQEDGEGPAPVDDGDVEVLINLLRLPQNVAKQMLQKVVLNLCGHQQTRQTTLRLLVSSLRAQGADSSTDAGPSSGQSVVEEIEDSLQPVASKRFLDMLIHLARSKPRVAQELPALAVPLPAAQDPKGKSVASAAAEVPSIQVLFSLLGSTLCRRSNSHLILALHLLEFILSASKDRTSKPAKGPSIAAGSRELPVVPENEEPSVPGPASSAPEPSAASAGRSAVQLPAVALEGMQEGAVPMEAADSGAQARSGGPQTPQPGSSSSPRQQDASIRTAAARAAIEQLPHEDIQLVARLLGRQRLSELACTRIAAVALLLVECAPQHRDALLTVLDEELQRCGQEAAVELQRMADAAHGSRASQAGAPVLRILQTVTALCKADAPQASAEKQRAALDKSAARLEPLWGILSHCISRIEDGLGQQTPQQEQAHLLPPEAAQVLPFVEAFFVLCDARTMHLPQPEPAMLRAASSELARSAGISEFAHAASTSAAGLPSPMPSGQLVPRQQHVLDAHLPFLRFAERHRKLLNALLRQHPNLLEGSLAPLLRVARLVDFDNKRAYFRTKVRSQVTERHYGPLRINVRREHVFEDSFHQLRVRSPEEMRAKLSVHFQGEEGIDAGGVSREWYQVMAREMFNPNFSLFVPVPEGGTTFQPNPNSIVQNDEARGTNHLDFFKFVGRVVGKALYDGQFVDAYFTRSLYKHMLDQRLTYLDIEAVDPGYFKTLAWMLENDITDVLDLTFTEEVDYFGRKEIKELKAGGKDIKVTNANKREFVSLATEHRMTTAIRGQLDAFLGGFWDLIPKDLVKVFNDHELELLISGLPEIDIDDLRDNTEYSGFTAASTAIQWFWQVVRGLEKQDLALLVQFVTGTSKVPLEGFKALQGISGPQKFQIHKAYGAQDRLPSAHTCFNQLDLIEYEDIDTLRLRMLTAIREGSEGFGFG